MKLVQLNDVFVKIRNGKSIKQIDGSSGYPITRIETIAKEFIDESKLGYADINIIEPYTHYLLDDGDILFSHINSIPHLGKCALFFNGEQKIIHGMNLLCFKPDKQKIYPKFALYTLRSSYFKTQLPKITNKSVNQASISVGNLKKLQIPLPPLAEQKRIAGILDKADEILKKRQQAIKECDEFLKATLLDMFGDPVINSKEFDVVSLQDICLKVTDGTHQSPKFIPSGIPFIFISNIIDNKITLGTNKFISEDTYEKLTKTSPIELGDILYTTVGSYGNPAIVNFNDKFCFQRHIAHIKPDSSKVNTLFLFGQLMSPAVKNQADRKVKGIAQKTLNLGELKKFRILLPPLPLQQKFANIVEQTEAMKTRMQESAAELDNNFNNLMQRAFKGEL